MPRVTARGGSAGQASHGVGVWAGGEGCGGRIAAAAPRDVTNGPAMCETHCVLSNRKCRYMLFEILKYGRDHKPHLQQVVGAGASVAARALSALRRPGGTVRGPWGAVTASSGVVQATLWLGQRAPGEAYVGRMHRRQAQPRGEGPRSDTPLRCSSCTAFAGGRRAGPPVSCRGSAPTGSRTAGGRAAARARLAEAGDCRRARVEGAVAGVRDGGQGCWSPLGAAARAVDCATIVAAARRYMGSCHPCGSTIMFTHPTSVLRPRRRVQRLTRPQPAARAGAARAPPRQQPPAHARARPRPARARAPARAWSARRRCRTAHLGVRTGTPSKGAAGVVGSF